jgi:hypothetical protein
LRTCESAASRCSRLLASADLEGIVAKWQDGTYEIDGVSTSWLKIRNAEYSQMTGRRELFERWHDRRGRDWRAPQLRPAATP